MLWFAELSRCVMSRDLERAAAVLRAWAKTTPSVRHIYLYGSRISGESRSESDLNVAIDLDAQPSDGDPMTTFICQARQWRAQLKGRTPFELDIQLLDANNTPRVRSGVESTGILIYIRAKIRPKALTTPAPSAYDGAPLSVDFPCQERSLK